jgi:caspase domain-containing protein
MPTDCVRAEESMRLRIRVWTRPVLCLALWAAAYTQAGISRWALCIGSNHGLAGEKPLRFAGRDADRMAALLRSSSTFAKGRVMTLSETSPDAVEVAMADIAKGMSQARRSGAEPVLVFYFSGHGKGGGIHIAGREFSKARLAAWLDSLDSDLKILILDACESGDFLRDKGGEYVETPRIIETEKLGGRGAIVLSSSARGEYSQESDAYEGGVFSHHFFNGLSGLADYNGDGTITPTEAFDYTRKSTLMDGGDGAGQHQNPTYDFDVVGASEVELIRPGKGGATLRLEGMPPTLVEVRESPSMRTVAALRLTGLPKAAFALSPGRYVLAMGAGKDTRLAEVDLAWKREARLRPDDFLPQGRGGTRAKGAAAWLPVQVALSIGGFRPFAQGIEARGRLALQWRGIRWVPEASIGYARSSAKPVADLDVERRHYLLEAGAAYAFASAWWGRALIGGRCSFQRVAQTVSDDRFGNDTIFTENGAFPLRRKSSANAFGASLPFSVEIFLHHRFSLTLSASAEALTFRNGSTGSREYSLSPSADAALGFLF